MPFSVKKESLNFAQSNQFIYNTVFTQFKVHNKQQEHLTGNYQLKVSTDVHVIIRETYLQRLA